MCGSLDSFKLSFSFFRRFKWPRSSSRTSEGSQQPTGMASQEGSSTVSSGSARSNPFDILLRLTDSNIGFQTYADKGSPRDNAANEITTLHDVGQATLGKESGVDGDLLKMPSEAKDATQPSVSGVKQGVLKDDKQPSDDDREKHPVEERHFMLERQPRRMDRVLDDVPPQSFLQDPERQPRKKDDKVPDDAQPADSDKERQPRKKKNKVLDDVQSLDVNQEVPPLGVQSPERIAEKD